MHPASAAPAVSSAQVRWGNEELSCHARGLRWVRPGQVRDEAWDGVLGIAFRDVTMKVYGTAVARWMHLSIELRDHTWIRVISRDERAFACANIALRSAMPLIARRLAGELQAGREVSFGDVALSPTTLRVRGKSWPLDQVAGYRASGGHWMLDIGPRETPMMKAMINLGRFVNYAAFCMLIEHLRPGLDYGPNPVDRGTVLRPSASSHDPSSVSGRTRLLMLGGLLGAGLLAGLIYMIYESFISHAYLQQREHEQAEAKKLFTALQGLAAQETTPFACSSPLEDGSDSGQLVGALAAAPGAVGLPKGLPVVFESDASGLGLSDTVSMDWARYVVLGEVVSATGSTSSKSGAARIALRVTEKASGKVVCHGLSEVVIKPDASDTSYADSDLLSQLEHAAVYPVCAAGGPRLCKSIYRIARPEPPASAPPPPASAPPPPAPGPVKKKSRRH